MCVSIPIMWVLLKKNAWERKYNVCYGEETKFSTLKNLKTYIKNSRKIFNWKDEDLLH